MLKIGDKFESFHEFSDKLKEYEKQVFSKYWIRDSRTLKKQSNRYPDGLASKANSNLKYYYLRIACIKGGREHVPKGKVRPTLTFRQGCQAGMFVKLSASCQHLELVEINENHNHPVSPSLFDLLPNQKSYLQEEVEICAKEALNANVKKAMTQDMKLEEEPECSSTSYEQEKANMIKEKILNDEISKYINILSVVHRCDTHVLCDEDENLLCLLFQDTEMKDTFAAYPEILFVDDTYCLPDKKALSYFIMSEDSEGNGALIAAAILFNDDEATIDWFLKKFKECNPNATEVKIIMSDKDSKETASLKRCFPQAHLQICLFRAVQHFSKEISTKNMGLTSEECEFAKKCFTRMARATSEAAYEEECTKLKIGLPKIVTEYFERNWWYIKDQWVSYLTSNNMSFLNKPTKQENIYRTLKSAVCQACNVEEFIISFFTCLKSIRAERNMSNSLHFHKVCTNKFSAGSTEYLYKSLLTNYAFEKVKQQMDSMTEVKDLYAISGDKCVAYRYNSEGLLQVAVSSCQCLFWTSMCLPCCHIFHLRSALNLPLFDDNLCAKRWTSEYFKSYIHQLQTDNHLITNQKVSVTKVQNDLTQQQQHSPLTNFQKMKMMRDECQKLSQLCSEVPSSLFYERLEVIRNIYETWSNCDEDPIPDTNLNECVHHDSQLTAERSENNIDCDPHEYGIKHENDYDDNQLDCDPDFEQSHLKSVDVTLSESSEATFCEELEDAPSSLKRCSKKKKRALSESSSSCGFKTEMVNTSECL